MKAYLIDPFVPAITEVEYSGDYNQIYKLIDCDLFTCVDIDTGDASDTLFVDDEGLISGKPQEFFMIGDYPTPLAGKGLVLGTDQNGESIAPSVDLEKLKNMVTFMPSFMVRAIYS